MRGWLRAFTAEGLNLERLLRQAGDEHITLLRLRRIGAKKLSALVEEDHLPRLTELAQKGGWRFTLGRRHGAAALWEWLKGHAALMIALLAVVAVMAAVSQMMLRVVIEGAGPYRADMDSYLRSLGVTPVCWKRSVDPGELRDQLEWRYPKLAWIECGWRGMTLKITVAAGTPIGDTVILRGAGDVVASRDGIISSIVTLAGTPLVEPGDIVRKGQALILGEERSGSDTVRIVSARGVVMARVWDAATVRMPLIETETTYTGRSTEWTAVETPWFDLWPKPKREWDQQDTSLRRLPLGGLFLPLTVRRETAMEAVIRQSPSNLSQLKTEAAVAALRRLRKKIGLDDDLVDKWIDYCIIEGEELEATAIGERVIDIARKQRVDAEGKTSL